MHVYKLYLGQSDSKSELMILMFLLLKENILSRGRSGIITTLARWHCACTEIPDEISLLTISSGELWSTLFVPQSMKIKDKVEFEGNFRFLILQKKFQFYLQGYQSLTRYVRRNVQIKHLLTWLCLILRNLQLIKYLKANHLVKNFVLTIFYTNQAYYSFGRG